MPTVNINTATKDALGAIPDATPKMVHEFEEYRPYVSIQQYRKEIGKYVSADQVTAWEAHLYVPIDPSTCDAPTLAQWPGLDDAAAAKVLEGRPFADQAAFLAAVGAAVSPAELAAGQSLLK